MSFHGGFDPDHLREVLAKDKVAVTLREGGGLLRAGVAMFNNRSDVDKLMSVLGKLAQVRHRPSAVSHRLDDGAGR